MLLNSLSACGKFCLCVSPFGTSIQCSTCRNTSLWKSGLDSLFFFPLYSGLGLTSCSVFCCRFRWARSKRMVTCAVFWWREYFYLHCTSELIQDTRFLLVMLYIVWAFCRTCFFPLLSYWSPFNLWLGWSLIVFSLYINFNLFCCFTCVFVWELPFSKHRLWMMMVLLLTNA
jgi:hypothetical protein